MKHFTAALTITLLAVGCASNGGKMNDPLKKKPAPSALTPDQANYFEIKKDGKSYLLGSNDSLKAFNAGTMPEMKETKFDNGKTVAIENASYNDYNRLVAEYKKAKGL